MANAFKTDGLIVGSYTTAQRLALVPVDGLIVRDTDLSKYLYWSESTGTWNEIGSNPTNPDIIFTAEKDPLGNAKLTYSKVGSLDANSDVDGLTIQEILSNMFYPILTPTYSNPSVSLTDVNTSLPEEVEYGTVITIEPKITYNARKWVTSGYTMYDPSNQPVDPDVGGGSQEFWLDVSNDNGTSWTLHNQKATTNPSTTYVTGDTLYTFDPETITVLDTLKWRVKATHDAGEQAYDSRQNAHSFVIGSTTYSVYPAGDTSYASDLIQPKFVIYSNTASSQKDTDITSGTYTSVTTTGLMTAGSDLILSFGWGTDDGTSTHSFAVPQLYGSPTAIYNENTVTAADPNDYFTTNLIGDYLKTTNAFTKKVGPVGNETDIIYDVYEFQGSRGSIKIKVQF